MSVEIRASADSPRLFGVVCFWLFLAIFCWLAVNVDVFIAVGSMNVLGLAMLTALLLLFGSPIWGLALLLRSRRLIAVYGVSLLALLIMFALPWHPRKAFTRDLASIKPGMPIGQVEQIMGHYPKGRGEKWGQREPIQYPVGIERALMRGKMTYRWNETDGRYDSDWGEITFYDGLVTRVEFMAD